MDLGNYKFNGEKVFKYKAFDPAAEYLTMDKEVVLSTGELNIKKMELLQDRFYAQGKESILIILQAMDAAGKDGAIKHVMTGLNPQGVEVTNFKKPSSEDLSHDYLWRCIKNLPARGKIGIFNRSYYEDVLIARVHELYKTQNLPDRCKSSGIFEKRYEQIINFEKYLWENGTRVIKFFFCISKDEQKRRFLKRIDDKNKNWKLSDADVQERKYWDDYMKAYELAINSTATQHSPWYVVPSDKKWFARSFVSQVLTEVMEKIDPHYPKVTKEKEKMVQKCKGLLLNEK
ncbi:MAG: Polyphosphate:ADP phosphotransferase [Eubacteriales bacterium SKADARSKE-1]|nr:Polyphosphate:ADP phosphotransferase [Eubacteriales bacterium SKADARSKE-1]